MREMRTWPIDRFIALIDQLADITGFPWIMLRGENTFEEMMSLIANATFFVGNDSGPAIIAQSLSIPSVVLFGATRAEQVLFNANAYGLTRDVGCNGCRHVTRHTTIGCAAPVCIQGITVESVLERVRTAIKRAQMT